MSTVGTTLTGIRFIVGGSGFRGTVALSDLGSLGTDPSATLATAAQTYEAELRRISDWNESIKEHRTEGKTTTAQQAWDLGELILGLNRRLNDQGFGILDLYAHLSDHCGIPSWSHHAVVFRRNVPSRHYIPVELSWRKIRDRAGSEGREIVARYQGNDHA